MKLDGCVYFVKSNNLYNSLYIIKMSLFFSDWIGQFRGFENVIILMLYKVVVQKNV